MNMLYGYETTHFPMSKLTSFRYIKDMNIVHNATIMQLFIYPFLSRTFASPDQIVTKNILSYHY